MLCIIRKPKRAFYTYIVNHFYNVNIWQITKSLCIILFVKSKKYQLADIFLIFQPCGKLNDGTSFIRIIYFEYIKRDNYLNFFLNGEYSPFMGWVVGVVLEALNRTRIIQNGFLNNCYAIIQKLLFCIKPQ